MNKEKRQFSARIKAVFTAAAGMLVCLVLGLILVGCRRKPAAETEPEIVTFEHPYNNKTAVGYYAEVLGTVKRVKPVSQARNEGEIFGITEYPVYGNSNSGFLGNDNVTKRAGVIAEANYLAATGTVNAGSGTKYVWMDKDGLLYNGTTAKPDPALYEQGSLAGQQRQLYAHTAATGNYLGNVSDNEPGIIKRVTMRPRGYDGYGVTGVYAPAGEVVKVQLSEKDMTATGGIAVHIGQALYNGKANNIWKEKNQMQRFPVLLNTMQVNKDTAVYDEKTGLWTAYVGSFLGGPIYIRNENVTFTATISGGVSYSHFILGYTSKAEFEQNAKSSAPYFDLEVWDLGVLHSGPKKYAERFGFEDISKAATLWDKVALVTTTNSAQGIVFLYDPFVAAGAAVAFPGQRSVNCPTGWMADSLDYNGIVTRGAWGNFHEYHHNFQNYGVGNGGEVTNNGMNLVSYALFTKISSARSVSNYGAEGLSGWNRYTSASWALEQTCKIMRGEAPENGKQGLALYATLLHNFGPDDYIKAKVRQQKNYSAQNYVNYCKAWQDVTHNDMTYFFKEVLKGIDETQASELKNADYPVFVPVSCAYQTGRSYHYDGQKRYIQTMQPYVIPFGKDFTFDLGKYSVNNGMYAGGSIVLPDGLSYKIKSVSAPEHGRLSEGEDGTYTYAPDPAHAYSGKIVVTLEITNADGSPVSFKTDDVDLILGFEQSHETNKFVLERTTYTFAEGECYTDAVEAYNDNYGRATGEVTKDASNPVQNCNTDIWFYPATEQYKDSPYVVKPNTIAETRGKLYFQDAGKYRIYLRGRTNCAVYYSKDNWETEALGATIKTCPAKNSHLFRPTDPDSYFDVEMQAESWLYFKTVLIVQSSPAVSYIGLGVASWTVPMFTIVEKHYASDGTEVSGPDAAGYHHTETLYFDRSGQQVTEEQANSAELTAPVISNSQQPYATAYRSSYEFPRSEFTTDYFYEREYKTSYSVTYANAEGATAECDQPCWLAPSGLLTEGGGDNNRFQMNNKDGKMPVTLTVDMGHVITANRCEITGFYNGNKYYPTSFKIIVAENKEDFEDESKTKVFFDCSDTTVQSVNGSVNVNFTVGEMFTFRYYKMTIYKVSMGTPQISYIRFKQVVDGTAEKYSPDDERFVYEGNWNTVRASSSFGHLYIAEEAGATMKFSFTGTRLAVLSTVAYENEFEVYIDGEKAESVPLVPLSEYTDVGYVYLSSVLGEGEHSVEIRSLGKLYVDSIAVY